jgi:ParB/RepB/Spo0J family partition protein
MTTTAAVPIKTEDIVLLPVDQLHRSPTQPRKRGGDKPPSNDFVDSIRQQGVIQPIVVRARVDGGWEIVYGHRRWEGTKIAGLDEIPAIIRALTDDEVFEAQLVENIHREDMHPIDEADGFKRMIEHGRDVKYIAERLGRPAAYVVQRLQLCSLGKEVRAAYDAEEITLTVAVLLARIPGKLQTEALERVAGDSKFHEAPMSAVEAKKELEAHYLLRLDQAPFDITDAQLVPKAGACNACPKRTGNQMELYPDAAGPDLCTDPICHHGKVDAIWKIRVKQAKVVGQPVIEGNAVEKALAYNGGYKNLDSEEWTGNGHKKVRSIFGKELPPITLARDPQGKILELVKAGDLEKAIRKNRPASTSSHTSASPAEVSRRKSEEAKGLRTAAAVNLAVTVAVERVDRMTDNGLVRLLVQTLIGLCYEENEDTIRRRLPAQEGGKKAPVDAEKAMLAHLKTLTAAADVAGLGLELVLRTGAPARWKTADPVWSETLKTLGLKFDTFEKQAAAEAKAKAKADADAKKQAKKTAKAAKKGKAKA